MKNNTINKIFYDSVLSITNKLGWKDPFKARKIKRLINSVNPSESEHLQTILTASLKAAEESFSAQPRYPTLGSPGDHSTEMLITVVRDVFLQLQTRCLLPVQPMSSPVGMGFQLGWSSEDKLEIIKHSVEAATRKLNVSWSVQAEQDVRGVDSAFKEELYKALVQEIVLQFTIEHINTINKLSEKNNIEHVNITDDKMNCSSLKAAIFTQCNLIAKDTRRSTGNWIVIPKNKILFDCMFDKQPLVPNEDYGLCFVGVWENLNVYVASSTVLDQSSILVGYKGKTTELDGGLIFHPYVMLLPAGVVVDPNSFEPSYMTLATRYSLYEGVNASLYYRKVTFS